MDALYILRLNGIILIIGCIEYINMKQCVLFYHLQSVSVLHIPFKLLNLIDLSHIIMKTSLNITAVHTHISSDHWIFVLDFTGFLSRVKTSRFYWILGRGPLDFSAECIGVRADGDEHIEMSTNDHE